MIKKLFHFPRRAQSGFTLVETLIYMGLLSIFLVILTNLFVATVEVKTEAEARSSVDQDSRYILSRLEYDVSRATSITSPATIGGTSSSLSLVIGGQTYTYLVSGGNLTLTTSAGTTNLNSSDSTVSNLTFTKFGNSGVPNTKESVRINFTSTSVATRNRGAEVRTFQTTVGRKQ